MKVREVFGWMLRFWSGRCKVSGLVVCFVGWEVCAGFDRVGCL